MTTTTKEPLRLLSKPEVLDRANRGDADDDASEALIQSNLAHAKKAALRSGTAPRRRPHRADRGDADDDAEPPRLISKPEVLDRVGVSYPTIWQWMREGKFPRSRDLGGKSAWVEAEINHWIATRPVRRLKGD